MNYSLSFNHVYCMAMKDACRSVKRTKSMYRIVAEYIIHFCGWRGGCCQFCDWHNRPKFINSFTGLIPNPDAHPTRHEIEEERDEILRWVTKFGDKEWEWVKSHLRHVGQTADPKILEGITQIEVLRACS